MKLPARPRKFRNVPTSVGDVLFDSKREAARYQELRLLERAGEITALRVQPRYPLAVNGVPICAYVGDFAVALVRAAAFCRTAAAVAADLADDADAVVDDARAADLTTRAARLAASARDFTACARLERAGDLD